MPVAVVVVAAAAAAAKQYSAHRQELAAKEAGNTQAAGVAKAQAESKAATERAIDTVNTGFGQARDQINSGAAQAQQNLLSGQSNSLNALNSGYDAGRNDLTNNYNSADQNLLSGYQQAQSTLRPTADQGNQASNVQAALSGALGPEAQAQAYQNYTASPGQQYLRDQQEQALLRNESALGGGVSANGRVMTALQDQAFGRAQTDFSNDYARLGGIADRGYNANQNIASLQASLGQSRSGLQQQLGNLLAGQSINRGVGVAGINTGYANDFANLNQSTATQLANSLQGQSTTNSNSMIGQGSEQAQLAQNYGVAKSAGALFQAQNAAPISQGVQQFANTYSSMQGGGGGMGGMFSGSSNSMQQGAQQSGYTGAGYSNWLAGQR